MSLHISILEFYRRSHRAKDPTKIRDNERKVKRQRLLPHYETKCDDRDTDEESLREPVLQ